MHEKQKKSAGHRRLTVVTKRCTYLSPIELIRILNATKPSDLGEVAGDGRRKITFECVVRMIFHIRLSGAVIVYGEKAWTSRVPTDRFLAFSRGEDHVENRRDRR